MITRKFSSFKTKEVALQIVSALCWFGLLKNATSHSQRFFATISTVTVIDLRKCWSIAIHGFVHLTSIWSWSWRRNNILFYFSSKYIMNYITSFSFQKETCLQQTAVNTVFKYLCQYSWSAGEPSWIRNHSCSWGLELSLSTLYTT